MKTNQQNKIEQTKNNKGNNFLCIKISKRVVGLSTFLYAQNLFVKEKNWFGIVLITSF